MAEKMEEDADESLGRDRKANTERRARFAASAEAGARNLQAMAKTMRNVAQALTAGKAKFLDRIRTRTQIELLQTYVANAKGDQLRAKYPTYAEQEKRRGEPPDVETADYAEFPSYTAYRSDLASLGRQLLEVDGTKKLGERLMKVADDVSDAFTAWAKEPGNLFRLSTFSVRSGEDVKTAIFKDRETAERAIKRSGLSGKAIVFPEKRGVNRVIMSPSEAIAKGIWTGDGDKRITLSDEFGAELVEGIGRVAKRQAKDRMNARAAATPWQFERAYERRKQLQRMGLETPAEFRSALREFISLREQAIEADRVKMLERAMVGKAKDGLDFFPTPESVADEMIAAADIKPDMAVLEPSAGMGHIADRIRAAGAEPDVIEMANDRRELLQEKGYHLQPYYDFLQMEPRKFFTYGDVFRAPDGKEGTLRGLGGMGSQRVRLEDEAGNRIGYYQRDEVEGVRLRGTQSGYDRIIMNPPFSNGRDIDHVRHAYTLLKPGGRIVAIMGESAFTNQNKKATEFREWLDSVGGTEEKLPAGTFNDPSLPVNTGANARMVVIDRSESDTPFSRASTGRGIPESDARNLASILRAALPKAPPIIIHDSVDKAPQSLRDAIYAEGAERDVEAAYHEGEIHVFPGHIESAERFNFVVGHHEMRHYGIRGILGQQYKQVLTGIAMRNPTLRAAARAKQDAGLAKDLATGVDEALADMPVEEIAALSGIDRLVSRIRQWLRETAAKLREHKLFALADAIDPKEWTDKDVAHFVWKVEDFARRGGSPMSTGGTMFGRDADEPAFYSALTKAIDGAGMKAAPAGGWSQFLKGLVQKGAVKQDEITWSGVEEWLGMQPGKVSREDLSDFVRENGVRVKETVLSDGGTTDLPPGWEVRRATEDDDVESRWVLVDDQGEVRGEGNTSAQAMEDGWDADSAADVPTKYSQYTLPGGTNYREVLLTLPGRRDATLYAGAELWVNGSFFGRYQSRAEAERSAVPHQARGRTTEVRDVGEVTGLEREMYRSNHWDQPNILAHIRVNDRTDAEGKRVLFVEELQSDYAQDARRKGFSGPHKAGDKLSVMQNGQMVEVTALKATENGLTYVEREDGSRFNVSDKDGVPRAPFVDKTDKWVALALKRVIKMAVDGGYDRVAFVTGEQSADRYDLSKQISKVEFERTSGGIGAAPADLGPGMLYAYGMDGRKVVSEYLADPAKAEDYVGKEVAQRLLNQPGRATRSAGMGAHVRTLEGMNLKVGGEGMRAFYDKIVPAVAKDVLRKVGGGSVGSVDMRVGKPPENPEALQFQIDHPEMYGAEARRLATQELAGRRSQQPGFDITPAMREKAAGGLPMFSRTQGWTIQSAAKAFRRMVDQAEDDLAGVLFNWNESELKDDQIVSYPGRDSYKTMGEAEGGKTTTPKREFMAWLMSDGPFDTKVYGPDIAQNEEWVGQINRLRALASEQTTTRFSRAPGLNMSRKDITKAARNTLSDMLSDAGKKVSWWDKSIGTQYAKARKFRSFGIVFDKVQEYIEDTSTLATQAADMAPDILPKLEKWSDFKKMGISAKDAEAVAAPIFEGTLSNERYDEATLRSRFGLNDRQVNAYGEFYRAVNESLDQVMAAEVIRLLGDKSDALRSLALEDRAALRSGVEQFLDEQVEANPQDAEMVALRDDIRDKYARVDKLKADGYAPLMRFGRYKVHIVDPSSDQTMFFGLYESAADANRAARELMEDPEMQGFRVEQGVLSEKQYEMFAAMPMDSLEMFAEALGAQESDVFKEYIRLAKNNRSALKRLLKRKGTAGYSTDARRVLAAFVTSNARLAAGALNLPGAKEAALNIRDGDVQDEAIGLIQSIQNPQGGAAWARGLMFVNFIGGSIASALVNVTQPLTMTLPWLSQWGGMTKAGKRLMEAGKIASTGKGMDAELAAALKRAEDDGIVSPQEIHYLQSQAMGKMGGHPILQRAAFIWAAPFTMAEQFNRRTSFIAAYLTAKQEGMGEAAFDFAQRAVVETQGLYNPGNQANWARNPVGAAVLTFKQFSVHYLEWMRRMWSAGTPGSAERKAGRKAVLYAMAILILAAGTEGLPFADDLDDLIDTIGQALGYDLNSKRARREFVANTLGMGDLGADVVARGFSAMGGVPFDVSLRMSMGNLVPGTGMLLRSNVDKSREVLELAGPAGGLIDQYTKAGEKALQGDAAGAALQAMPVAIQNVGKAVGMWTTGEARDSKDRRIMEADTMDGLMRFLGFNPQSIARESDKMGMLRRSEQLAKNVEGEIAADWARAQADGDREGVQEAKQRLRDWNQRNPGQQIRITGAQILRRVQQLRRDRRERFITSTSPERRREVSEALQ